jgi:hypothetical protein
MAEQSAKEGADHLRQKLGQAGDQVKTADDFIRRIASKSFLSGQPYVMKLPARHTQPTADRLGGHLAETRKLLR